MSAESTKSRGLRGNMSYVGARVRGLWVIVLGIVLATTTCHASCLDFKVLCCLGLVLLESIFIELESILLLESYVCFSKINVALYQYDIFK